MATSGMHTFEVESTNTGRSPVLSFVLHELKKIMAVGRFVRCRARLVSCAATVMTWLVPCIALLSLFCTVLGVLILRTATPHWVAFPFHLAAVVDTVMCAMIHVEGRRCIAQVFPSNGGSMYAGPVGGAREIVASGGRGREPSRFQETTGTQSERGCCACCCLWALAIAHALCCKILAAAAGPLVDALVDADGGPTPDVQETYYRALVFFHVEGMRPLLMVLWAVLYLLLGCELRRKHRQDLAEDGGEMEVGLLPEICCETSSGQLQRPLPPRPRNFMSWFALRVIFVVWAICTVGMALVAFFGLVDNLISTDCALGACYTECNPLATSRSSCLMPFPSSAWELDSGKLRIPDSAAPLLRSGRRVRLNSLLDNLDGWSPASQILFELPGMPASSLAGYSNAMGTMFPGTTTLIIHAGTGQPVAHYAEKDVMSSPLDIGVLQPAQLLQLGERYVVVVQGVRAEGAPGTPLNGDMGSDHSPPLLPAPVSFQHVWKSVLEASAPSSDTNISISSLASRYRKEVIPVLRKGQAASLIPRLEDVQLCWDFTVRSPQSFPKLHATRAIAAMLLGTDGSERRRQLHTGLSHVVEKTNSTRRVLANAPEKTQPRWNFDARLQLAKILDRPGDSCRDVQLQVDPIDEDFSEDPPGMPDLARMATELASSTTGWQTVKGRFWCRIRSPRVLDQRARDAVFREDVLQALEGWKDGAHTESGAAAMLSKLFKADGQHVEVPVLVQVPCTLSPAGPHAPPQPKVKVTRVLFFAHGVFNRKEEAGVPPVVSVASRLQAIIVSLDLRGFSRSHLVWVMRMLLKEPEQMVALGANVLQGFIDHAAAVAWVKQGGLRDILHARPGFEHIEMADELQVLFYGYSCGGILGAGLVSNVVPFDRAALGASAVPFTSVIARSADFRIYKQVMLRGVYGGHNVRLALAIWTVCFDDFTAAAMGSTKRPFPLTERLLLQAGLGDPEVAVIGTETLFNSFEDTFPRMRALAFSSAWLVNPLANVSFSPRTVERVGHRGNSSRPWADVEPGAPQVWITEMLFEREFLAIPKDSSIPEVQQLYATPTWMNVHLCLRQDPLVRLQLVQFMGASRVLDICSFGERVAWSSPQEYASVGRSLSGTWSLPAAGCRRADALESCARL